MLRFFSRLFRSDETFLSESWLLERARKEEKTTGIDGPCFRWPINKLRDENGRLNRWLLRKEDTTEELRKTGT